MEYKHKVLIVDDDDSVVKALSFKFQNAGMDICIAKDGVEGLAMTRSERPDVVVLDILMPQMDGLEMLRELRKDPALESQKVVILTNKDTDDEILNQLIENHPAYYLLKANVAIDDVVFKVQDLLREQSPAK